MQHHDEQGNYLWDVSSKPIMARESWIAREHEEPLRYVVSRLPQEVVLAISKVAPVLIAAPVTFSGYVGAAPAGGPAVIGSIYRQLFLAVPRLKSTIQSPMNWLTSSASIQLQAATVWTRTTHERRLKRIVLPKNGDSPAPTALQKWLTGPTTMSLGTIRSKRAKSILGGSWFLEWANNHRQRLRGQTINVNGGWYMS